MKKPIGQQGSWYARWDGEEIPCVHRHPTLLKGLHYSAPTWDSPERHLRYFRDIERLGRVILTKSDLLEGGHYKRMGYIALWRVENVELTPDGRIELDLVEKLEEFR